MIRSLPLVAIVALAACSGGQRRGDEGVRIVEGEERGAQARVVVGRPTPVAPAPAAAVPPVAASVAAPSPDLPRPRRDFVDPALPPELTQDGGLVPLPPRPPGNGGGR